MSGITITGGTANGRTIFEVPGKARPTPARMRKAYFDILGEIDGLGFVDLFAGSGAMGIEALSRGASFIYFVEIDKMHCKAIDKNVSTIFGKGAPTGIFCEDALLWIKTARELSGKLVFCSPPYIGDYLPKVYKTIENIGARAKDENFIATLQFPKREFTKLEAITGSFSRIIGDDVLIFWGTE
jgi:16S rRNA (guanine966-N2)-methyltransferase